MTTPDEDRTLFDRMTEVLYTAVVHDVLTEMGYRKQRFPADITPLIEGTKLAGRAATMEALPVPEGSDLDDAFKVVLKYLDELSPNAVVVATGRLPEPVGLVGEIMSHTAKARGARGAIVDGHGRDAAFLRRMDFPSFYAGYTPGGIGGKDGLSIQRMGKDLTLTNGTVVHTGDLVFADDDGALVIPHNIEAEVLERSFTKTADESKVREEIRAGASIQDTYAKYGVL